MAKEKLAPAPKTKKENRINRFGVFDFILVFVLSLMGLLIVYPFYNTILVSIVPQAEYVRQPFMLWPSSITWECYEFVFDSPLLLKSMWNSAKLTLAGTVYNMILTVLMAYAFTKPIPADLSQWPNLAALRERLVSDDMMLTVDGKLYGWPSSRENPDWIQNAYYCMFAYRRDWAQAVGMYKEGDAYTWDEVKAMIKAVQEQDPGNNGAGNTIGITSETWAFPGVFMEVLGYAEDRNGYVKDETGSYVPYFTTDTYREELKFVVDLFQGGYIWKDQVVDSGSDGANHFTAGTAFMFLGNNSPSWFSGTAYPKMVDTGIVSSVDDVAPMIVYSPVDNKSFWLTETEDYWTVSHINHGVDDEKLNRILDMWNWLASEEGRIFSVAGLEGLDYEKNDDGTYTILWDTNPDGSYISPYVDTASNIYTPATQNASPNETSRMDGFEAFEAIHEFIQTSADYHVHPINWEQVTFGGEQYAMYGSFSSDVTAKITEIIAAGGDVDAQWDAFLAEMEPKWKPVAEELNAQLG